MKKKLPILILVIVSLLVSLSLPAAVFSVAVFFPSQYQDTFLGELPFKIRRLKENRDKKKIVIIGGSSVPFSIRSPMMEEYLPSYQVIDFGLYADLGTKCMLDLALPYVAKDDIVILSPELHPQTLSMHFDPMSALQAIDGEFSLYYSFDTEERKKMRSTLGEFSRNKYSHIRKSEKPKTDGIYMRSSFDGYGDISSSLSERNVMDDLFDKTTPISFDSSQIDEGFVDYLNGYYRKVVDKKARMYYRFAPMNRKAAVDGFSLDSFYSALDSKIDFAILGNPHDSLLEAEWFYDTNFHLNNAGAIVNTSNLIREIKLALHDDSRTEFVLPDKPIPLQKEVYQEDDSDVMCFDFEDNGKEAWALSLTEEGKNKKELIVPSMYHGLPVRYFDKDVFSSSDGKTVTVQRNVTELLDGCLKGVSKLIIKNPNPSRIRVGYSLFEGSDAKIFVEDEYLSAYKNNYSFSQYGERIHPLSKIDRV